MKKHLFPIIFATFFGIFAPATVTLLPIQPTPQSIAQADDSQHMTSIAQQFIELVAAGNFQTAHDLLHPSFQETWTPAQMRSQWNYLQKATGTFENIIQTRTEGDSVVLVRTQFEQTTDDVVVIFDDRQQSIVGVDFPEQFDRPN